MTEAFNNAPTDLLERALSSGNMQRVWKQVRCNKGSAGVDGMTIEAAVPWLREHWQSVKADVSSGRLFRKRLATTNMQERLNEEIRRREKVIRIFPNEDSAMRLIGALLDEKHESWSTGKRYFDMTEFHEWRKAKQKQQCQKVRSII